VPWIIIQIYNFFLVRGMLSRARGWRFSPATMNIVPGYFFLKENRRKIEAKEFPRAV